MNPLNPHHAYAVTGGKHNALPAVMSFLEKDLRIKTKNNPDFFYQEFETFTIDDGRDLQERHLKRSLSERKIFIILTRFMTLEAQNALLKIFEEPSEKAIFFIIMPNTQILLPTLRSRLSVVKNPENRPFENIETDASPLSVMTKNFLSATPMERLAIVRDIIEQKDKGRAIDFVVSLEQTLALKISANQPLTKNSELADALSQILLVKKYLHDRAPSVKLLLEHLCLTLMY